MSSVVAAPPGVAAVIVTYNRLDKLKVTVERTLKLPFTDVVVVNNASTDGTKEWLNSLSDVRLRCIHAAENLGGAGGFARGFDDAARLTSAEWLVCFDDDAYPAEDALDVFAQLPLTEEVAGVAAAVFLPSGGISTMNCPGVSPFHSWRLLMRALRRRKNRFGVPYSAYESAALCNVSYSSFVGFFVRCHLVRGVLGLPRAELFIYGDDALFTLNIVKHGYQLKFAPTVRFIHDCETLQQQRRVYHPLWKVYYIFRNGVTFYRQMSGAYFYPVMLPILLLSWLGPARHYTNRRRFLRLALVALWDGLRADFTKSHRQVVSLANGCSTHHVKRISRGQ